MGALRTGAELLYQRRSTKRKSMCGRRSMAPKSGKFVRFSRSLGRPAARQAITTTAIHHVVEVDEIGWVDGQTGFSTKGAAVLTGVGRSTFRLGDSLKQQLSTVSSCLAGLG